MIHPDTELRFVSPEVGYGVFATRRIPRGTITWALDPLDRRWSALEAEALGPAFEPILRRYGYLDDEGKRVISWDHGRYVNHSCAPSTASGGDDHFEVALRDIEVGEEITDDYGEFLADETFLCRCGAATCRGDVGFGSPLEERSCAQLRAQVQEALRAGRHLPQPLLAFALDRARLERALELGTSALEPEPLA